MPRKAKELKAIEVQRLTHAGVHAVGVVPGLCLQVREPESVANDGASRSCRTWILRATVGSKRRWLGLGGYPEVTLAQAHERARAARELIRNGVDPIAQRREAKSSLIAAQATAITFKQATVKYIEAHESGWRNTKHAQQWRNTLETYADPVIGAMLVRDIEQPHVLRILEPLWLSKTETATRLRGRIESVLDWAKGRGYRSGDNPAAWKGNLDAQLAKPGTVANKTHHPAVAIDDVAAFVKRLQAVDGQSARCLEFVILTATRSGAARGARWSEIDLKVATWRIPPERMKGRKNKAKEHRVPLSRAAVRLLKAQLEGPGDGFVFPSPRGGQLSDMALTAVMRRLNVEAVPHGFRSTFRDWAGDRTTYPRDLCEAALAHVIANQTEAAYRRSDALERRRPMMEDWAQFCTTPALGKAAKVVPITSRKRA